jgi:hypothetical protein
MTLIVPPGKFANIINFVVGAWTGGWLKIILIGLVIGGSLWWFRLWLNQHDDKVAEQAKQKTIAVLEQQYVVTWQQKLTEAKNLTDQANARYDAADIQLHQVNQNIGAIFSTLSSMQRIMNERKVIYVKEAAAVPRPELDATIRAISNYIAAGAPH